MVGLVGCACAGQTEDRPRLREEGVGGSRLCGLWAFWRLDGYGWSVGLQTLLDHD